MWKWIKRRESAVRDIAKADALAAERQTDTVPGKAGGVPGEYLTLHHYLTNRYADIVLLTFDQIEGACLASDCQNARGPSRRGGRGPTETGTSRRVQMPGSWLA